MTTINAKKEVSPFKDNNISAIESKTKIYFPNRQNKKSRSKSRETKHYQNKIHKFIE